MFTTKFQSIHLSKYTRVDKRHFMHVMFKHLCFSNNEYAIVQLVFRSLSRHYFAESQ